ncbi:MAG: hypothetical protein ABI844_02370 [Saprospiraceae bacterium]
MDFTKNDFKEVSDLVALQLRVDNIDAEYLHSISDDIFQNQPFFLTVLLGYRLDTSPEELEEIMKIYFLIWEYFKINKGVRVRQVTQEDFEKIQRRYIEMLQYAEGEVNQQGRIQVYSYDLQDTRAKALLTAILFRYNNRPILVKMEEQKKGIILIGIKSFIECFDLLDNGK